eukprot:2950335-Prymnesium_polylepis.1
MARLQRIIESTLKGTVIEADERYIRAQFESSGIAGTAIDDAEFFFAPNDTLIQFRAARRASPRRRVGCFRPRAANREP